MSTPDALALDTERREAVRAGLPDVVGDGRKRAVSLWIGVAIVATALLASIFVRFFGIGHPNTPNFGDLLASPSLSHPFGTDALGRDVFIRTIYATLTDFQVGAIGTVAPFAIGVCLGAVAGYSRGWFGSIIMRFIEFLQAFPFLILVLVVVAIHPGITGVYIGLTLGGLPIYVRLTRAEMLVLREQQFVMAAQTLGFSTPRIVVKHAMPHVLRPNLVYSISDLLSKILSLAALSYLGLGVPPPTAEWGSIIADGQTYLLTNWWIATLPGLFVVVIGVGITLIGEGVAERLRFRVTGKVAA